MICVHTLRGGEIWINPDLIVTIESPGHDTHVVMADGHRLTLSDNPASIAAAVVRYRASVIAAAETLQDALTPSSDPAPAAGTSAYADTPTSGPQEV